MKSIQLAFLLLFSPVVLSQETLDLLSFYFAFNSDFISLKDQPRSQEIRRFATIKIKNVILKAYTDTVGDDQSNLKLAKLRLDAVEKLFSKDVEVVERIIVGEDHSNLSDRYKRRVDVLTLDDPEVIPDVKPKTVEEKPVLPPEIELGVPIALNIVFQGGTYIILEESYSQIDELLLIMKTDTTLLLQLNGHVCCMNDLELSVQRARAVKSVLMNNGIDEKRMSTEGFGNTKPIVPDDTEAHRHSNRRVEAVFSRAQ